MCSKKCAALTFLYIYVSFDLVLNLIFMTDGLKTIDNFFYFSSFADSLIDVWSLAIIRDLFLLTIAFIILVHHRIIHSFIKYFHRKYMSALTCLIMYSYVMIKLLVHADNREKKTIHVFMFMWNIAASFLFFIVWYGLSLLKLFDYKKTNIDGGENENGDEADIFLDTIKETQKKRSSLMRLFKYSKYDWHYILFGTFFLVLGAIAEAFVPYYTGQTLDSILVQQNMGSFTKNVYFFISANFMSGFIGGLRTCMFSIAVSRLNVRLRRLLFTSFIRQDIGFYDKVNTGDILSRLASDTTTMSDLIAQNLNGFLWNVVRTIGTLIFVFKLSWQLSLICFIGAPICFAIGEIFGQYYRTLSNNATKRMADSNHVAEETLSTIRTVRSFANEDGELKRYNFTLQEFYKLKLKQAIVFSFYDWAVKIAQLVMTVSMLAYGAHLVTTKQITSGDFMSFVIYQLTLSSCLEGLTSVYTGLMSAAGASEKVFEYLDKPTDPDLNGTYKSDHVKGEIEFKNVSFSYPARNEIRVLNNISFTAKPGEVVAFVGPSGSGKSSCLSLLERFYKPDSGDIFVDGISIRKYDHKFIHQVISIVSQEPTLYARTVQENIAYGIEDATFESVEKAAKMGNAHDFILRTSSGYLTECGERGIQLSGGQKQRVAIARALIRNPNILLLDEATSALDAETEYQVQQAISKNYKGHTVLIVAHRLSTIENADKIIVLNNGQIVEQGNHKELLRKNGLYAYLVNKQIHGSNDDSKSQSGASTPLIPSMQPLSYFHMNDDRCSRRSDIEF